MYKVPEKKRELKKSKINGTNLRENTFWTVKNFEKGRNLLSRALLNITGKDIGTGITFSRAKVISRRCKNGIPLSHRRAEVISRSLHKEIPLSHTAQVSLNPKSISPR